MKNVGNHPILDIIGGTITENTMREVERIMRREERQRARRKVASPQQRKDTVEEICVALEDENVLLREELEEAKRGQERYEQLWTYLIEGYFYDPRMMQELHRAALAVHDYERAAQLKASVENYMRPPNQTMNVFGTNNGMAAMNTTGGNYAFNQKGGATWG